MSFKYYIKPWEISSNNLVDITDHPPQITFEVLSNIVEKQLLES